MELLSIVAISSVVFGGGCAILASNKHRDPFGWFVLGCLFSLVALIVIAALPAIDEAVLREEAERRKNLREHEPSGSDELRQKASELAASLAQSKSKLQQ